MNILKKASLVLTSTVFILSGVMAIFTPPKASAFTPSFNPANLIDDGIFTNSSSMSGSAIQTFLTSLNSNLATYTVVENCGSKSGLHYNFYKSHYSCGQTVLAARMISDAAKAYNISPRSILATMQKEQSLVTTPPGQATPHQINCAMGYLSCDSSVLGFFNQVDNGAWQFRADIELMNGRSYWGYSPSSYPCRTAKAQYSTGLYPNRTVTFTNSGGSTKRTIKIANSATAALHCYTPYVGPYSETGYSGSYNFVYYFELWWGSVHKYVKPVGVRPSSESVYARSKCSVPSFSNTYVGRLYHPDTHDFLYTTSRAEACGATKLGYIWDGIVMQNVPSNNANAEPVYRLANNANHLFTTSSSVRDDYVSEHGYHSEGIGWYVYNTNVSGSIPATELTKQTGGLFTVMLTAASDEASFYNHSYGYTTYGTAFYTPNMNAASTGSSNVYRVSRKNHRLYTDSAIEQKLAVRLYGYKDEGVVSKGDMSPGPNNLPVYRLRSSTNINDYFFTTNRKERDLAVVNYNYLSEGTGFYEPEQSSKPIYRITQYTRSVFRLYTNSSLEKNLAVKAYSYHNEGVGWYSN